MDVGTSEDGAFWLAFLRSRARGLSGVELVISDAHRGLTDAIAKLAEMSHPLHDELTRVPSAQPWVATMVIYPAAGGALPIREGGRAAE